MQRDILGQRYGQIKAQSQITVALLEAVDLLLGLTAALGQQNFCILNGRGVQGGKAVRGIGVTQNLHHALQLLLLSRQQLHKSGQSPGGNAFHR